MVQKYPYSEREPEIIGLHRFETLEGAGLTTILLLLLLANSVRRIRAGRC